MTDKPIKTGNPREKRRKIGLLEPDPELYRSERIKPAAAPTKKKAAVRKAFRHLRIYRPLSQSAGLRGATSLFLSRCRHQFSCSEDRITAVKRTSKTSNMR